MEKNKEDVEVISEISSMQDLRDVIAGKKKVVFKKEESEDEESQEEE
jgi:hypothetical protein